MRGNITKRGKNSWQLKFDVPSRDGKRQQRYASVRGTYQDAQKKLTSLLKASDDDLLPDPTRVTVAEYVRDWLASAHAQSPKTLERYGEIAERQIIPHIGGEVLQKLKPETVTTWHGTLLEGGLSARTVGHAHRLLRLILARAVKNGTLPRNVAAIHSPPKVEETEVEVLSPEQIPVVLEALQGHTLHPIASLALATGMRRGELLALQWGAVELDVPKPFLRVERSVEETKAGLRVKPPKTKRGRRTISLPPEAVDMLRAHKVKQMQMRLVLGMGKPDETTLVLSDVEGRMISPHSVSRAWRMLCLTKKTASRSVPRIALHACQRADPQGRGHPHHQSPSRAQQSERDARRLRASDRWR